MNPQYNNSHKVMYREKVWLVKSTLFAADDKPNSRYNVCFESDGELIALDQIMLRPDGTYFRNGKELGQLDDESFKKYIEKLVGVSSATEEEFFDQVCEAYARCGSVPGVMKELGISKERTRKILITRGKLKNAVIENIAFLYDGGKGKSLVEIAEVLGINENTVWKNMAYT